MQWKFCTKCRYTIYYDICLFVFKIFLVEYKLNTHYFVLNKILNKFLFYNLHKIFFKVMKCKMCGKEYCSKQNYEKHIKSGSCQVTYKCNDCQKIFKKMNTLMEHRKKKIQIYR